MICKWFKYCQLLFLAACSLIVHAHENDTATNASGFIKNNGQWQNNSSYLAQLTGAEVYFEKNAFQYFFEHEGDVQEFFDHKKNPHLFNPKTIRRHAVRMEFINASESTSVSGHAPRRHHLNFIQGNNHASWKSNVPVFNDIFYNEIYNGIDMRVFQGTQKGLKYEFYIAPAANPEAIRMNYSGTDKIYLKNGNLHIKTSVSHWIETKPFAYQKINGVITPIACAFVLHGNTVSFIVGEYNREEILVIDPELIFSTYSGSGSDNFGHTATFDNNGNLYTAGIVRNPSSLPGGKYPVTAGAFQTTWGGGAGTWPQFGFPCDIGISKYNNDGTALMYATYFGGNQNDYPISLVVDKYEQLILLGATLSANFPVKSTAYSTSKSDSFDLVVSRFSADGGSLVGSTFFGGNGIDGINIADTLRMNYSDEFRGEILVTERNEIIFVSSSTSTNLTAHPGAYQAAKSGKQDGIIVKMDSALTRVMRFTYMGKSRHDALYSLDIDKFGNYVVAGGTQSAEFTTTPGTTWGNYKGGISEGFVAKIDSSLSFVSSFRYWGSPGYDQIHFIKLDPQQNIVVLGQTYDSVGVTTGTYSNNKGTLFITKFTPNLWDIIWSTQIGNGAARNALSPSAFMVDVCGGIYGSVWGGGTNEASRYAQLHQNIFVSSTSLLPVTPNAIQPFTDGSDFWLFCLKPNADTLAFATYFGEQGGEDHVDGGTSRFDRRGIVYQSVCASCASGPLGAFPTTPGSYSPTNPSPRCSNASFKIDFRQDNIVTADFSISPRNGCTDSVFTFTNKSHNGTKFYWYLNGALLDSAINPGVNYQIQKTINISGSYTMKLLVIDPGKCNLRDSIVKTFSASPSSNAAFTVIKDSCSSLLIFKNMSSYANNEIGPFTWYFGDGNISKNYNPTHQYEFNGTYTVRLITSQGGQCADTATSIVNYDTLQYKLKAGFKPKDTLRCEPTLLRIENSSQNGSAFKWYVNNILISTSQSGFDSIAQKGSYAVKLVIFDSTTCVHLDSIERTFYVVPVTYPDFDWEVDSCLLGAQFRNQSLINPGDTAAYLWDFGDGTFSTDSAPFHEYSDTGTYTVTLKANANFPCTETMQKQVVISPGTSVLNASFSVSPLIMCEPDTFIATDKSINADKRYWHVAGIVKDSSSSVFKDVINYEGLTELMLVAYNENTCTSYDTSTFVIPSFSSSNADFIVKRDSCSPNIIITNLSSGTGQDPVNYQWYFGDGNATTDQDPRHEYLQDGTYTITLITNPGSPCSDTATQQVIYNHDAHLLTADILLSDSALCTPAIFTAARTGINGTHFYWLLNNAVVSTDSLYTDTLFINGKYTLKLVVIDSNTCNVGDTIEKIIDVALYTNADFKMERDSCSLDVTFINLSANDGTPYIWQFGDGDSSVERNPKHQYAVTDDYEVMLIYSPGTFCADTARYNYFIDGDSASEVIIPNVFTPNGDGLNDCFRVSGVSDKCDEYYIKVFNRWGLVIYEDTNGSNCWNGKDQAGDDLPQGVYFYIMLIKKKTGYELNDRGTITLIRETQ